MNYQLAKKLKDAEFPFKEWYLEEHSGKSSELQWDNKDWEFPTLSELIEACGEDFNQLIRVVDSKDDVDNRGLLKWIACGDDPENIRKVISLDGPTAETAVANLWLDLNKEV